jgi:hypothetical protein
MRRIFGDARETCRSGLGTCSDLHGHLFRNVSTCHTASCKTSEGFRNPVPVRNASGRDAYPESLGEVSERSQRNPDAPQATTWVLTRQDHCLNRCARADTKNPPPRLGHRPTPSPRGEHCSSPSRSGLIARPAVRPHRKGTPERPALRAWRTGSHVLRPCPHCQSAQRGSRRPRERAPGRMMNGREPEACPRTIGV